ncbi:hypothetical protein RGQ15_11080 [Paracoccus sp. MBLB3053]|uniref:Ig-like domain-containing protein n=1 Tax=Paracoccus aurantius TaxID=3073814 RepID=A0ABU2HV12_9RHOB|nr:hypothetical protein [Paracoccus sp. MBLB3053]MDS9468109.1 hypothetical protein [Paracoccus sp. MBLB3053]
MAIQIHDGLSLALFNNLGEVWLGDDPAELYDAAGSLIAGAPPTIAPVITQAPSILPTDASIGQSISLNIGQADGSPVPQAHWDFTLDGMSIRDRLDEGAMTMELSDPGEYELAVTWTNSAGMATSTADALKVVLPEVKVIDYDAVTLAYFNAADSLAALSDDLASLTTRGTGGYAFAKTGSGTTARMTDKGIVFADGIYLQSQTLSNQPATDGLFAVADVTLDGYGSNIGQILDGTGGHVKLRNNGGTLQGTGTDDTSVNLTLGPAVYSSRVIIAVEIDDVADTVSGFDASGNLVAASHPGLTDPSPNRFSLGRYLKGTIHRFAIVGRAEGKAWPITMREVVEDFRRGA